MTVVIFNRSSPTPSTVVVEAAPVAPPTSGGGGVVVDPPNTDYSGYGGGYTGSTYVHGGQRFFQGFEWRFIFTDLNSATKTWAQGLQTGRQITWALNQPTLIETGIHPDDFRVNGLMPSGYPRVSQLNTLVYCFRREGMRTDTHQYDAAGNMITGPWHIQAAGRLFSPEDEGDVDSVMSHIHAHDPWKLLEGRPVMDAAGVRPGPDGFTYLGTGGVRADVIALTVLKNTITNTSANGGEGTVHIDAGIANGGTVYYNGTIQQCPKVVFTVQQGGNVADVWNQLCSEGMCDIVLEPIYDARRPGYTHQLSIYKLAGTARPNAMFAWDRLNRSVVKASRVHDGTPGAFFDVIQYYAGQGGAPVPLLGPLLNADAITAFGRVWSQQFWPAQTSTDITGGSTLKLAKQALLLAKQGRRTYTVETVAERAPVPLLAYHVGDRVQVDNSKRMRRAAAGLQRVEGFTISIDDDGVERATNILCSPDYRAPA